MLKKAHSCSVVGSGGSYEGEQSGKLPKLSIAKHIGIPHPANGQNDLGACWVVLLKEIYKRTFDSALGT
jgi:hypothetical protein